MKQNENKKLEEFVDHVFQHVTLDKPSSDFTSRVMARVQVEKASQLTKYKPLITREAFALLLVLIGAFFIYIMLNTDSSQQESTPWLDLSELYTFNFSLGFSFSKITLYAVITMTIMLFVQIPILKYYIQKQYQV